jgi:hypothetical protein
MGWRSISMALCLIWVGQAIAQSPDFKMPHGPASCAPNNGCPSVGCCPDDYCRNPCPAICSIPRCGGPDDYCRKPQPCLTAIPRCGGCDDYCRKPLPTLLCPPWSPFLQCGPSDRQCAPAPCR